MTWLCRQDMEREYVCAVSMKERVVSACLCICAGKVSVLSVCSMC